MHAAALHVQLHSTDQLPELIITKYPHAPTLHGEAYRTRRRKATVMQVR